MAEPFLGEICIFGFNYAPIGWSSCQGQSLPVAQYQALYSLLGVYYGGSPNTNFNLPNLQGRLPLGFNNTFPIGAAGGAVAVAIGVNNLPPHNHPATMTMSSLSATTTLNATTKTGGAATPVANSTLCAATSGTGTANIYLAPPSPAPADLVPLGNISTAVSGSGTVTVGNTGLGQSLNVLNPFLAINFSIAMEGIYPTRN